MIQEFQTFDDWFLSSKLPYDDFDSAKTAWLAMELQCKQRLRATRVMMSREIKRLSDENFQLKQKDEL